MRVVFSLYALQVVEKLEKRKGVKLTKRYHVFSLEIPFFGILAKFDVIFKGEGMELEQIWCHLFVNYNSSAVQIPNQIFRSVSSF